MPIFGLVLFVFTSLASIQPTAHVRIWKTVYMDEETGCGAFIRNDDLQEGDMYLIKSDSWQGQYPWLRRPAECTININLGDRLVAVNLVEWWCDKVFRDPFLAVYDTCLGDKTNLLAHYNCTSVTPRTVYSTSTCISLYHFRGHTRYGYFFSLELVGRYEVIAFPAGGIAALIVMCIVVVMVIVKVVCVISGYDSKLPAVRVDPEDPKQTLLTLDTGGSPEGGTQETSTTPGTGSGSSCPATAPTVSSPLHKSHSSGAFGAARVSEGNHECWDSDGIENYSPPRLKRYVSVRASRILKL